MLANNGGRRVAEHEVHEKRCYNVIGINDPLL